jgi:hypothetical protein
MVEYGVTLNELETFFIEEYEPQGAEVTRKRQRQLKAPDRQKKAKHAIKTRWEKYDAMKTSHLVAKEEARERVAEVPKPNILSFAEKE